MLKTTMKIKGMHCDSCKEIIEEVCQEISGVRKCEVRVEAGVATIEHDAPLDDQTLIQEIEGLGVYKVLDIQREGRDDAPGAP